VRGWRNQYMGRIEWELVHTDSRTGQQVKHSEGAQTVFGLARARKILKLLGPGWRIQHRDDRSDPGDREE
jgi:hypothetical protein